MNSQPIRLDDNGIPILDQIVSSEDTADEKATTEASVPAEENRAVNNEDDQNSLTEEQIQAAIDKLTEEFRTRLQTTIPELLAKAGRKGHV